ncbi:peroxidase 45-like [Typha latifolia]|uniref:peroxidase 45-like n=1 Tax=Typha latifolia TaxID=4733 RepID=UPI003C2F0A44
MENFRILLLLPFFLLSLILSPRTTTAQLSPNYYANICPNVESIVRGVVAQKMNQSPIAGPASLRLLFHDCFVAGCDASVMLISPVGDDEWRSPEDMTLKPEGFDVIISAKAAVDSDPQCTNKVSCADIIAIAARDAVALSRGPFYTVELGRYDGKISTKSSVVLPHPEFNLDQLNSMFGAFGLTQTDMIALSGAHTIGAAGCPSFYNRLYNYAPNQPTDPSMNQGFAAQLQQTCPRVFSPSAFAFLDATTSATFDNVYYQNLQRGMGLLGSDQVLFTDPRSANTVNQFASNQIVFFTAFVDAITKMGRIGVKTAVDGEIRRDCRFVN